MLRKDVGLVLVLLALITPLCRAAEPDWTVLPLGVVPPGLFAQAAIGDVDGDGRNELLVVPASLTPTLSIYSVSSTDNVTLQDTVALPVSPSDSSRYAQPKILDVNGDGRNDIALYLRANNASGKLILLQQTSAGYEQFVYAMPETDAAYNFAMADLDGDGLPEVMTADHGYAAPQTLFVTHNGTGPDRFTHSDVYPFPFAGIPGLAGFGYRGIVHIYVGDLNGDGFVDVAVSTHPYNSTAARIWFNDTTGHLASFTDLPGQPSIDLELGDINNDGTVDVVANGDRGNDVRIFGRAAGGYVAPFTLVPGGDPRTPILSDFDRDGSPDLVTANTTTRNLSFFYGDPTTRSIAPSTLPVILTDPQLAAADFSTGGVAETLAAGDLDNDGDTDLVLIVDRLFWIRNNHVRPDTTPPTIESVVATPAILWPPNRKFVPVTVTVSATDLVDPAPAAHIVSVTSNEGPDGDWVITGPLTLLLRADRYGKGTGRTYTITVAVSDAAGNTSEGIVTVTVDHDQR